MGEPGDKRSFAAAVAAVDDDADKRHKPESANDAEAASAPATPIPRSGPGSSNDSDPMSGIERLMKQMLEQQNQMFMAVLAQVQQVHAVPQASQAPSTPQQPPAPTAPKQKEKVPDWVSKLLKKHTREFSRDLQASVRENRRHKKLADEIAELANANYPKSIRPYKASLQFVELEHLWTETTGGPKTLHIEVPEDLSRRDAITSIHRQSFAFIKQIEMEAQQEATDAAAAIANRAKLLEKVDAIIADLDTPDKAAQYGLAKPVALGLSPQTVRDHAEKEYTKMYEEFEDKLKKADEKAAKLSQDAQKSLDNLSPEKPAEILRAAIKQEVGKSLEEAGVIPPEVDMVPQPAERSTAQEFVQSLAKNDQSPDQGGQNTLVSPQAKAKAQPKKGKGGAQDAGKGKGKKGKGKKGKGKDAANSKGQKGKAGKDYMSSGKGKGAQGR